MDLSNVSAARLDHAKVVDLFERARKEVDEGHLPSCQVAIARNGIVGATATFGAPEASRYVIYSATKPVVALAMWLLLDEGLFRVEDPVSDHIPEFATNGKRDITIEQVMLHTAGFPRASLTSPDWETRQGRLAAFAKWYTNWEPGSRYEYHPESAHWVLAELIERGSGVPYRQFIAERVIGAFGLTRLQLGVPIDQPRDINDVVAIGNAITADELEAALGIRELPRSTVTPEGLIRLSTPYGCTIGLPGGGGVSNASDLALFYQHLLNGCDGLLSDEAYQDFTVNVRNTMSDFLGTPANRTLGMTVAGADGKASLRGMGKTVSPATFGHNGAGGQIAWADPETGISFVYLTNGLDQHPIREARRTTAIASRAGACAQA